VQRDAPHLQGEEAAMTESFETRITRTIVGAYHGKLSRSLVSDVLIAGADPSGLRAAIDLAVIHSYASATPLKENDHA
jgi:ribulose 1,5-bisphosphate synthetase/thiazole synthase